MTHLKNSALQGERSESADGVVFIKDLREDIVQPSMPREQLLATAEKNDGEFIIVDKVVD